MQTSENTAPIAASATSLPETSPCAAYRASAIDGMNRMIALLTTDVSSQPLAKSELVRPQVR